MKRLLTIVGLLLTALDSVGCNKPSSSSTASSSGDTRNISSSTRPPGNSVNESKPGKDGRLILSVSSAGFTVNGSPVVMERTTKPEVEKLLGPMDRIVDVNEAERAGLWDGKGLRAYFSKRTQVVSHFDCMFVTEEDALIPELQPRRPFDGVFKVESIAISKATTKADLQGRVEGKLLNHSVGRLGFSVRYRGHSISFDLLKDQTGLEMVRISSW
jgi:hypothetical protein